MKKSVREYVGFKVNGIISKVNLGVSSLGCLFWFRCGIFTLLNLLSGAETVRILGTAFTRKIKNKLDEREMKWLMRIY